MQQLEDGRDQDLLLSAAQCTFKLLAGAKSFTKWMAPCHTPCEVAAGVVWMWETTIRTAACEFYGEF